MDRQKHTTVGLFDFLKTKTSSSLTPEQIIRNLVDDMPDFYTTHKQFKDCVEFLQYREWGLALESLIEMATESQHFFSNNFWLGLADAADKMKMNEEANYCREQTKVIRSKILDEINGTILLSDNFTISNKTTSEDLILHFGQSNIEIRDMQNGWKHYDIHNTRSNKIYLRLTFYFNNDMLSSLSFIIDDKQILPNSWDNWSKENELQKKEYFDNWLTKQLGERRKFPWGTVSADFDNKGGFSGIVLRYS